MVSRKTVCLRRLGGSRKGELRVGRFFANAKVTGGRIVAGWSRLTGAACRGRHVLAIQDRSEVHIPTTPARRRGLGPVGHGNIHGVLVHAMLAVDAATGACLGLVGGDVWSRAGVNPVPHRERAGEQRESACWLAATAEASRVLQPAACITVVADREADMFALFGSAPAEVHLLIRSSTDRLLAGGGKLSAAVAGCPVAGRRRLKLRQRGPRQPAREAVVELRYGAVAIRRPEHERAPHESVPHESVRHESVRGLPSSVTLRVVDVCEVDPPETVAPETVAPETVAPGTVAPVHWRLLTTHAVEDAAAAWQIVEWYRRRWVIEQLFRVMKSQGLQLEDSQIASADRLVKLAAAATKAACIDIQLTQERDGKDELPASAVFEAAETETIAALIPTLEGGSERQRNPHAPRTLAWAAWCIARLGGWTGYYKPPGPITMRRGMQDFSAIHRGRQLNMKLQREVRIP